MRRITVLALFAAMTTTACREDAASDVVSVVIGHSISGSLEPCGCGQFQSGGAMGRREAVARLRAVQPAESPFEMVEGGDLLANGVATMDQILLPFLVDGLREEGVGVVCLGETDLHFSRQLVDAGFEVVLTNARDADPGIVKSAARGHVVFGSLIDPDMKPGVADYLGPPLPAFDRFCGEVTRRHALGVLMVHGSAAMRHALLKRIELSNAPLLVVDIHADTQHGITRSGRCAVVRTLRDARELIRLEGRCLSEHIGELALTTWEGLANAPAETRLPQMMETLGSDHRGEACALHVDLVQVTPAKSADALAVNGAYADALKHAVADGTQFDGYVGSAKCGECHRAEQENWGKTAHARAMSSLQRLGKEERTDCYFCHVTGDMTRTELGQMPRLPDPDLWGVGCEVCHGPGAEHAADPQRLTPPKVEANRCAACHRAKFDPNFSFEKRLPHATCQVAK